MGRSPSRTDNQTHLDAMKKGLEWLISQDGQPAIFQGKRAMGRSAITKGYLEES